MQSIIIIVKEGGENGKSYKIQPQASSDFLVYLLY